MHVKESMDALVVKTQISPLSFAAFLLSSQKPVNKCLCVVRSILQGMGLN